jgi:tetratricopeptide (TPR) repeat protein
MKKPAAHDQVNAVAHLLRGREYVRLKQFPQALTELAESLRLNPRMGDALMVRAGALVAMGEYQQALADVQRRLQLEPPEPMALLTCANLRAQLKETDAALADFTEFLRQKPGTVLALRARALSYARLRRFDEALADLNEVLQAEPANSDTLLDRGSIYQKQGNYAAATADYQKAVDLEPQEARFCNQFSWLLAACPQAEYRDGSRAVELARRACKVTNWKDGNVLDTLASAYAECGRFDEAVKWVNKALELAPAEVKETVAKHVELFRTGQPARMEENPAP